MSTDHNLFEERRAEADSNRGPSDYQPNALPLGQTGSHRHSASVSRYMHAESMQQQRQTLSTGLRHPSFKEGHRETERETDRQTKRQTERQRDTQREPELELENFILQGFSQKPV